MTHFQAPDCPMAGACIFPRCKGWRWRGKAATVADTKAFEADVTAYMQRHRTNWPGRAAAAVYQQAVDDPTECMLA